MFLFCGERAKITSVVTEQYQLHVPYLPVDGPERALTRFESMMQQRRSIRSFSARPVETALIRSVIRCAHMAPSGANKQPWRFVVVGDPDLKKEIRQGAEREEEAFYGGRATPSWLRDLKPLGTAANKPFLEEAPWLIAMFMLTQDDDGGQVYYPTESAGIAAGFLLAAAQEAGLATLTHTPSPMRFLNRILSRPKNERPFLLIPIGYPAEDCEVPAAALKKKRLQDVVVWHPPK